MTVQSTQCASEELDDLEEWLKSKGFSLVEQSEGELKPGEYTKKVNEPKDKTSGDSPVWTVTWHPKDE
jgi:hypothetical protein